MDLDLTFLHTPGRLDPKVPGVAEGLGKTAPRIAPGGRREIGTLNWLIVSAIGRATGGPPPRVFTTLARHRRLFRAWLRFAGRLMPRGSLRRIDTELVILRVTHNCGSEYEWRQHERIGAQAGLSAEQIEGVRTGGRAGCFSEHQMALISAVDELHAERRISDPTWATLAAGLSESQLIELCMLAGHYEMLAGTLNSLGVEPDELPARPGLATRLMGRSFAALALALLAGSSAPAAPRAAAALPELRDTAGLKVLSERRLSGRLITASLQTSALPAPAKVRILFPAGYRAHPRHRYPVLYLLHGTSGGAPDWTTVGEAQKATAGKRLIVVMPDIALDHDGGGWCANWPKGPYAWETFHIDQLLPWVDRNLPTIRNRRGRAIGGLSQGGFCSTSYAARHPDLFSAAYSYSGAPDIAYDPPARLGSTLIINATEVGLDGVAPNSIFGDRVSDEVNWAAHDPATLAENLRATRLYLYTGDGSPGPYDSAHPVTIPGYFSSAGLESLVHQDTIYFHNRLEALGIPSYFNDYGGGTHTWGYWARDLRWSMGHVMHDFKQPRRRPRQVTYTSAEDTYSVYGWRVRMQRDAREFSTLRGARCRSFTLSGSGSAIVRTPACLVPRGRYRISLNGDHANSKLRSRASRKGRLRIEVPLGPSNPYQQYTAQADAAGTAVYNTRVRIHRAGGAK